MATTTENTKPNRGTDLYNNPGTQASMSMSVEEKWGLIGSLGFYLHDTEPLEPFYFAGRSFSRPELLTRMISLREGLRRAGQPGAYSFSQAQERVLEALLDWLIATVTTPAAPTAAPVPVPAPVPAPAQQEKLEKRKKGATGKADANKYKPSRTNAA